MKHLNGDLFLHIPNGKDNMAAPQMWTRKDIIEFKGLLSKDSNSVLNIGSGELVTVSRSQSRSTLLFPFLGPFSH